MHTVSFIIYITVWLTPVCVLFDFYWIYIKICGESVPLRPDRAEKIYKSPEDLTKSVRFAGLFFLPREVYSRGLHGITTQHGKVANLWLDQFWEIVRNTPAGRRSESVLIHSAQMNCFLLKKSTRISQDSAQGYRKSWWTKHLNRKQKSERLSAVPK